MLVIAWVLGLASLAPLGAAAAAVVGLGVVRELGAGHVAAAAACVTLLPVLGGWAALGRQPIALSAAAWTWSALLLAGLPGFFPGEFPGAIGTGFAVFASAGGPEATARAARLAEEVPILSTGKAPPPAATRAPVDCARSAVPLAGDQVALPFEGSGHSMSIPVQIGEIELPMLFDTGASVTTLDEATLRRIGVRIPPDAPTLTLRTANGERTVRIVLLDRVWLGGLPVDGVTVGICEECADERTSGLLGLNVSGQFLVTVDTARKEVVFQARAGGQDRLIDLSPWLHVEATARVYPDTRVEVEVTGVNAASRVISEATVGLRCGEERFVATLVNVPPGGSATTTASLPRGTDCSTYRVSLDAGRW